MLSQLRRYDSATLLQPSDNETILHYTRNLLFLFTPSAHFNHSPY